MTICSYSLISGSHSFNLNIENEILNKLIVSRLLKRGEERMLKHFFSKAQIVNSLEQFLTDHILYSFFDQYNTFNFSCNTKRQGITSYS